MQGNHSFDNQVFNDLFSYGRNFWQMYETIHLKSSIPVIKYIFTALQT